MHAPRLVDQALQKSDASPGAMQLGEGFLIKEGGRGHGENLGQVESKVCFSPSPRPADPSKVSPLSSLSMSFRVFRMVMIILAQTALNVGIR